MAPGLLVSVDPEMKVYIASPAQSGPRTVQFNRSTNNSRIAATWLSTMSQDSSFPYIRANMKVCVVRQVWDNGNDRGYLGDLTQPLIKSRSHDDDDDCASSWKAQYYDKLSHFGSCANPEGFWFWMWEIKTMYVVSRLPAAMLLTVVSQCSLGFPGFCSGRSIT